MSSFKNGQRIRTIESSVFGVYTDEGESRTMTIAAGVYADVRDAAQGMGEQLLDVTLYVPQADGTTKSYHADHCGSSRFESVRGKPFVPGVDARRLDRSAPETAPARSASTAKPTAAEPDVDALLGTLRDALTAKPNGIDEEAVSALVDDKLHGLRCDVHDAKNELRTVHDILTSHECRIDSHVTLISDIHGKLEAVASALSTASPAVRARVRVALASTGGVNPIVDALAKFYTVGEEAPANVLLCSPPSLGKSYGVRTFAAGYDVYLEHGCSDDMDEIATLLGSPMPDGRGGFITVDGVLTQAVREASAGKNVLMLLDEVLRLSPRAQEWLLSFLTGVKRPDGSRVYRLRTRRVDASGALEVIECEAARLHIVGATNLGMLNPVEAFWSRWETVRLDFTTATVEAVAQAILSAHGIADPDRILSRAWAAIVQESRKAVAENKLRFPVDMRILERAAQLAPEPTIAAVGKVAAERLADNTAHWNADLGDTDPQSVAVCDAWATMLRSL
jgi:hypothetical protein